MGSGAGAAGRSPEMLGYYATPAPMTALAEHRAAADALPTGVASLCKVVQGLLIHPFWVSHYGIALRATGERELQARSAREMLQQVLALDAAALDLPRPPERRAVGNCRHFATLLVALLRNHGIPARARCGFGAYFTPDRFEDHWISEVWDAEEQRWRLVDPQIDDVQRAALGLDLDTQDLSREAFWVAGQAWLRCRAGENDPNHFGILDMWGDWFILANVARDLAALRKVELLPWDGFGLSELGPGARSPEHLALADRAAALCAARPLDPAAIAGLYEAEPLLRVPRVIRSYQPVPTDVDLGELAGEDA